MLDLDMNMQFYKVRLELSHLFNQDYKHILWDNLTEMLFD